MKQIIMDADPNLKRSMQILRDVDKVLSIYQCVYEDFKKEKKVRSMLKRIFQKN